MSTSKRIKKPNDAKDFDANERSIIQAVWLQLLDEKIVATGPKEHTMKNMRNLLKGLRRESSDMARIIPTDPPAKSAKYKYLYRFVGYRTKGQGDEIIDVSMDESMTSEEPLSQLND